VSTDERPYAKVDKLTKKEMGIGIHNHNPKSLKTAKVQQNSEEPKSRDIPKLTKQLEKSCSKSNIITFRKRRYKPISQIKLILLDAYMHMNSCADGNNNDNDDKSIFESDLDDEIDEEAEDRPDWFFDEGKTKSADPGYVFCPVVH
jgi:hypothetical protein